MAVAEKKPLTQAQYWKTHLVGKKITPKYQMYLDYLEEFEKENSDKIKCKTS